MKGKGKFKPSDWLLTAARWPNGATVAPVKTNHPTADKFQQTPSLTDGRFNV